MGAPPENVIVPLKKNFDYPAPDTSEIRLLVQGGSGGLCHCLLPAGAVSIAVKHKTVEELWYILEGSGHVWRDLKPGGVIDPISAGDSFRIPVDTAFQFRAAATSDLKILIVTMPRWPGADEAIPTAGGLERAP